MASSLKEQKVQDSQCNREFQTWGIEKYGIISKGKKALCVLLFSNSGMQSIVCKMVFSNKSQILLSKNVFWDLYCAAPERRDTCEHSSEAKAFHDYGFVNSGYAVNGIAHRSKLDLLLHDPFIWIPPRMQRKIFLSKLPNASSSRKLNGQVSYA
ncbi:single-stranded DNA-binding protein 4 [Trichonephila clavipes]|nr:single-stranded DNA-binding protein 4 [Trichonephila clavipes]